MKENKDKLVEYMCQFHSDHRNQGEVVALKSVGNKSRALLSLTTLSRAIA
jgi:hypothetical protein